MKTRKQAEAYARRIFEINGQRHVVFQVPEGSAAYRAGMRWATCEESERADYERDGAIFPPEVAR